MPRPVVGSSGWGTTLNTDLDGIEAVARARFRLRSGQWWTGPEHNHANGGSGANPTSGYLCLAPIVVPQDVTVDGIGCHVKGVGPAGATFRMGIYQDSNMQPGALLLDAGTVSGTTTGFKSITISQALTAGIYWLGGVQQGSGDCLVTGSSVTIPIPSTSADVGNVPGLQGWANNGGTTGALPATFTATFTRTGQDGNGAGFRILLKAA